MIFYIERGFMPTKEYSYTVLIQRNPDGGFIATVPALPGLVAEADNIEEAREAARTAIRAYINELFKSNKSIPQEQKIIQEKISVMVVI